MIPAGWLITRNLAPWAIALMWVACFLPILHYWSGYDGPNGIPLAAMLALYLMHKYAAIPARPSAEPSPALA